MRPYRWRLLKMFSWAMLGLGVIIFGYLGITYLSWGRDVPRLTGAEVLGERINADVERINTDVSSTSFGDLIAFNTKADPAPKVNLEELVNQKSILGLRDTTPQKSPYTEFSISVPRLNVHDAKVQIDVDGTNESIYLDVLKQAVAHFRGTAYPGERGNSFLFGHSMLPILASSSYESIFTNLPKLREGDVIQVKYGADELTYRIRQTGVVEPTDVSVLRQPHDQRLLTLMTCIPPGFGSNRFVATAELVE